MSQGWLGNCKESDVEEKINEYRGKGIEAEVREVAYDEDGITLMDRVALWRKGSPQYGIKEFIAGFYRK